MSEESPVRAFASDHPRVTAAAFTLLLLLSQAGAVIAGNSTGTTGP